MDSRLSQKALSIMCNRKIKHDDDYAKCTHVNEIRG